MFSIELDYSCTGWQLRIIKDNDEIIIHNIEIKDIEIDDNMTQLFAYVSKDNEAIYKLQSLELFFPYQDGCLISLAKFLPKFHHVLRILYEISKDEDTIENIANYTNIHDRKHILNMMCFVQSTKLKAEDLPFPFYIILPVLSINESFIDEELSKKYLTSLSMSTETTTSKDIVIANEKALEYLHKKYSDEINVLNMLLDKIITCSQYKIFKEINTLFFL
jgi:hypothetical protein